MKMQIRAQSYKSHPKGLNPARYSEITHPEGPTPLNERPLINSIKQINGNQPGTMGSAKVRLQRPQQYLIRKQLTIKEYESEIDKLTQICEEFYKENQNLKQCLRQQQAKPDQVWNRRVLTLENEIRKQREILDHKNTLISEMNNNYPKSPSIQNNNGSSDFSVNRLSLNGNPQHSPSSPETNNKVQKLMKQLERRESQLMKYMHKQAQFIQIYVEKERLQQQVRTLEHLVVSRTKQIEEINRNYKKLSEKCRGVELMPEQSEMELEKIKIYNDKLIEMLRVSSSQIERLNHKLKGKMQQVEKNRVVIQQQQNQIASFKQKQLDLENIQKVENEKGKIIKNLQFQTKQLQRQNSMLSKKLQDQISLSQKLQGLKERMQRELKEYKNIKKEDTQTQTDNWQTLEELVDDVNENNLKTNETEYELKEGQGMNWSLEKVMAERDQMQYIIEDYSQQIQAFHAENQELTKMIMEHNTQSLNLKDQIKKLKNSKHQMERQLQHLRLNEQKIPTLLHRVQYAEGKIAQVTNQYEKLLNEVLSSCSQTQTVHRQIEQILQQKLEILSQYEPSKAESEVSYSSRVKINKVHTGESEKFDESASIRFDKQFKSQSQAQLHSKE